MTISSRLFLKRDSDLAIAGSVKARGGIYEILKHSEDLTLRHGLLPAGGGNVAFASPAFWKFFHQYAIHVGSTGNLVLSISTIGAAMGYRVMVHMSAEAVWWKKGLLRAKGVTVLEYGEDYGGAVREGRRIAAQDPNSYFMDDENSKTCFWAMPWRHSGWNGSCAALRSVWMERTRCWFSSPAAWAARSAASHSV